MHKTPTQPSPSLQECSGEAQPGDIFMFVFMFLRAKDQIHRHPGAEVAQLSIQTGIFTP